MLDIFGSLGLALLLEVDSRGVYCRGALLALEDGDVFRFLEAEGDEEHVDGNENGTPVPDPSPALGLDHETRSDGAKSRTDSGKDEVPCIHGSVLVQEEDIGNGHLHDGLAQGSTQTCDEIRSHITAVAVDLGLPCDTSQLQCNANHVQRTTSVLVHKRHKQHAANAEASIGHGHSIVQLVDG